MKDNISCVGEMGIKRPPAGLAVLALVGPSLVWAAEYIGSGEVILATRTGAILGTTVLWAVVIVVFLKFWIGMSGARYTVCTGEGMIDMFERVPGPKHWAVWIVLVIQFIAAMFSIGALASSSAIFVHSILPIGRSLCGWIVALFAVAVVWSGMFNILKIVMSILVLIIILGILYVAGHVLPSFTEFLQNFCFKVPPVASWAVSIEGTDNPWKEILPLFGWAAGGFASQVWYTYWVIGAGYGATAGRGYGKPADATFLRQMSRDTAEKLKGWCRVLYVDSTIAMVIGIVVISAFFIAGAGILGPKQLAPQGTDLAIKLSELFSQRWGALGGLLFILAGSAALVSTLIGQLAGWPRLLADSFRICLPSIAGRFTWKKQFRFFLIFFFCTNMLIVFMLGKEPVRLIKFAALMDGILLTSLQALWVTIGLFVVMPKIFSKEASDILKPHWIFAVGLLVAFVVFTYFCIFQVPFSILALFKGSG